MLGTTIAFAIRMASNDSIVGAWHIPKEVQQRRALQLSPVTKYIRNHEQAAALLHERENCRRVVLAHKIEAQRLSVLET